MVNDLRTIWKYDVKKNSKKRFMYVMYITELLVILSSLFAFLFSQERPLKNNEILDSTAWTSEYVNISTGIKIEESDLPNNIIVTTENPTTWLTTGASYMNKGSYKLTIQYDCSNEQYVELSSLFPDEITYLNAGKILLSPGKHEICYNFSTREHMDAMNIKFKYNGIGTVKILGINLETTKDIQKRNLVITILMSCMLNLFFLAKDQYIEVFKCCEYCMLFAAIGALPILMPGIHVGHDLTFHLMRIEALAHDLKLGIFPTRVSSLWLDGYGYASSVYYNDMFLYIPALLRLCGFTVEESYKIYVFIINFATVWIAYFSFSHIFQKKNTAYIAAIIYELSAYRMVNLYVRAAVGEYTAMTFFPLVLLAIYHMYTDDVSDWKTYKKNILYLTFGMNGIFQSHMLSTEMVIISLIALCLCTIRQTCRKHTLQVYVVSILWCLFINLWFIVPFLDSYLRDMTQIKIIMSSFTRKLQNDGVYIGQLFSFFARPFGVSNEIIEDRMMLTPGIILMIGEVVGVILLLGKNKNRNLTIFTVVSSTYLFLSTNLFPWDTFIEKTAIGKIMSQIQFPWRWMAFATVCLTGVIGFILEDKNIIWIQNKSKEIKWCILTVSLIMVCLFTSQYMSGAISEKYYDIAQIDSASIGAGEYLLYNGDMISQLIKENSLSDQIITENASVNTLERIGNKIVVQAKSLKSHASITFPILNYYGYQVTSQDTDIEIGQDTYARIKINLPDNFDSAITLDYKEPLAWKICEIISVLAMIVFIGYSYCQKDRKEY